MHKRIKRYAAFTAVFALLIAAVPVSEVSAYTAEGSYNGISYVANADGDPGHAYMKISSSRAATHSGRISGQLQAFLGIPCGHTFSYLLKAKVTSSYGGTYYVDAQHTIYDANFIWYIDGRNIESYGMIIKPYRAK